MKLFFKIDKLTAIVAAIALAILTLVMLVLPYPLDRLSLWMYISGVIIIINVFFIRCYLKTRKVKNETTVGYALYIPSVVAFLIALAGDRVLFWLFNEEVKIGIVFHVVIFGASLLVQLVIAYCRNLIHGQEQEIAVKREWRAELVFQWGVISGKCIGEQKTEAHEIEEKLRYCDPMSSEELSGLETQIAQQTAEIKQLVQDGRDEQEILARMEEIKEKIDERNDRCKRLK